MDIEKLREIGLSDSEAKIYISLLELGEATVAEISRESGLHRTNIYDSLEKLKEKGFVSYLSKENRQFFRASDPGSLLVYWKEKEEKISRLVPELKALQSKVREKVTVEIFKGKQGMKSVLKDVLAEKEEVLGYSIAGQLRKYLPEFSEYYFREQTKYRIRHRFIYILKGPRPPSKYYEIRYLPKEFSNAIVELCCGDTILNLIWEPEMIAIRIRSEQLAENFKSNFSLLWKMAKKK